MRHEEFWDSYWSPDTWAMNLAFDLEQEPDLSDEAHLQLTLEKGRHRRSREYSRYERVRRSPNKSPKRGINTVFELCVLHWGEWRVVSKHSRKEDAKLVRKYERRPSKIVKQFVQSN